MKVIETEIEGLEGVETDVGWLARVRIAAVGDSYAGLTPWMPNHYYIYGVPAEKISNYSARCASYFAQ